jgi:Transposase
MKLSLFLLIVSCGLTVWLVLTNQIKVNARNTTRDAEGLNIRIHEIKANARGFRSFDNNRIRIFSKARLLSLIGLYNSGHEVQSPDPPPYLPRGANG